MKRMTKLLATVALLAAFALSGVSAQTNFQFPNAPWQAFAPSRVQCGWLYGANMNTTADQAIPMSVPSATYMIDSIAVSNPSVSLTTAAGGLSTGNSFLLTLATAGSTTDFQGPTQASAVNTLYLSLTTAQGAAATADVRVYCRPLF